MDKHHLALGRHGFGPQIGDLVREARRLIGWSQNELAVRAGTSQATIWRIESASGDHLDLLVVDRVLAALGVRATLDLEARHLDDRRRQADGLHARTNGFARRRLEGQAWLTAGEVQIGDDVPRGWIDTLAFRPADRSLLVEETKTEISDLGALQRTVAFYQREAPMVARSIGWMAGRVVVLVVALDTEAIADRIGSNREAFRQAFPCPAERTAAWLAEPTAPPPLGWTLGMVDPRSRGEGWLRPSAITSRRRPAYRDYRDAAVRLRVR